MNRTTQVALGLLVLLVCEAPVAFACRIIDPIPFPPPPRPPPVPPSVSPMLTRLHKAEIKVEGAVAKVEVSARFYNPNGFRIEGTYFFPIEADAVVKDFAMTVNGKEQEAELLEAGKARKIYEEIVRKAQDPGLLEYVGNRMLKARVFPIEPNAEVIVRLTYHQVAKADQGIYRLRYPFLSAKPNQGDVDQVAIRATVSSDTPVKLFYSPTHKIDITRKSDREVSGGFEQARTVPERDFDLYWSLDKADLGVSVGTYKPKNEDGYCMVALSPKVEVEKQKVEPKDIVFVFDKSGSMSGDKIKQARGALAYCLNSLNPADRFSVLVFGTDVEDLTSGLIDATAANIATVKGKVNDIEARGGTAIHDALTQALKRTAGGKRLTMLVFMTDGMPTVGETDIGQISTAVKKANATKARIFVFGVGDKVNTDLLDRLATENQGVQDYVGEQEDLEMKVSAFYEKIAQPVLSDIRVEVGGVKFKDLYPKEIPDIFRGGQVLVFGRYQGGGKQSVVVRGRAAGKDQVFECEADFDGTETGRFIPAIWAHRKVAYLLEQIRLNGHNKELEDEIVALGKRYGIMTPYTSFLIVEDQARPAFGMESRRQLEADKNGAVGTFLSRDIARAKGAEFAPAAAADADSGGGGSIGFSSAMPQARAGRMGIGGAPAKDDVREAMRRQMKKLADKVFYMASDGCYYDSVFDEKKDRQRIVEVKAFSDEYFDLLTRHKGIGQYLSEKLKIVICIDDKVYRISE